MIKIGDRLKKIYSILPSCNLFADIACDHGLITKAMLEGNKCKKAIISDISKKCLSKAEALLADYIDSGTVLSVVSDGFDNVGNCDLALIAGIGGEEIIKIIKKAKILPYKMVFQPMHNTKELRKFIVTNGYKITLDKVFFAEQKFYDIIVCEKGQDKLTEEEIEFGKTNISEKPADFIKKITNEIEKFELILSSESISDKSREDIVLKMEKMKKYV